MASGRDGLDWILSYLIVCNGIICLVWKFSNVTDRYLWSPERCSLDSGHPSAQDPTCTLFPVRAYYLASQFLQRYQPWPAQLRLRLNPHRYQHRRVLMQTAYRIRRPAKRRNKSSRSSRNTHYRWHISTLEKISTITKVHVLSCNPLLNSLTIASRYLTSSRWNTMNS